LPDEYLVWISEVELAACVKVDVNTGSTIPLTHLGLHAALSRRPRGWSLGTLKICCFGNLDQWVEK